MGATAAARWEIDRQGFHGDPRLRAAGFAAGMTTKAMGNMADADLRAQAARRLGLGEQPLHFLSQAHGNAVHSLAQASSQPQEGDGWIVDAPGRAAGVYSADCTPIYIWDEGGEAAAILHSGWKGTRANIAAAGVAALSRRAPVGRLRAAIGPRIGPCCYAVGEDFASFFRPSSLSRRGGKLYFDLGAEALEQLVEAGLSREGVSVSDSCTHCGGEFFSFRREKQGLRMAAFLAMAHVP